MAKPKLIIVREGNDENHVAVWQRNVGWRQMSLAGLEILRATLRPGMQVQSYDK